MNYEQTKDELGRITDLFRSVILTSNTYSDDASKLISWPSYIPGIFKNLYAKEYQTLVRDRQYSFLLTEDGGCLQFYYKYHEGVLLKAKLAYYPYPAVLREEDDDIEGYMDDTDDKLLEEYYYDLWLILSHRFELDVSDAQIRDLIEEARNSGNFEDEERFLYQRFEQRYKTTNTSHIRIDYDANVLSHHKCEIQFGGINVMRLPLKRLISPLMFFEWIIRYINPIKFSEITESTRYTPNRVMSKRNSTLMNPFEEDNIFIDHI